MVSEMAIFNLNTTLEQLRKKLFQHSFYFQFNWKIFCQMNLYSFRSKLDVSPNFFGKMTCDDLICSVSLEGIYFYNSHPIYKVDVLGTVVYKRERDNFFCYGGTDCVTVKNPLCFKEGKY